MYLITFLDLVSRLCKIKELDRIGTKKVIKALESKWIYLIARPESILTDQGRQYVSQEFEEYCVKHGIIHKTTSAYNPTGNSVAERINQRISLEIKLYKDKDISEIVKILENGINHGYHSGLDFSPHELLYNKSQFDYLDRRLNIDLQKVNERNVRRAQKELDRRNKKRIKSFKYKIGDNVLERNLNAFKGERI